MIFVYGFSEQALGGDGLYLPRKVLYCILSNGQRLAEIEEKSITLDITEQPFFTRITTPLY